MSYSRSMFRAWPILFLALVIAGLTGCKTKQEEALEQAKKQAAATGQAQQVTSVDKDGNTTTTVVQPPAPQVTTTPGAAPATTDASTIAPASQTAPVNQTTAAPVAATPGNPTITPVPPPTVSIPAGTTLTIRIDQHIGVKTSRVGDAFTGVIVQPVVASDNSNLVPQGTPVAGVVDASHRRGHFKGQSVLELRLTSLTLNGMQYPINTHDLVRRKKGKGKRSTALIAGGSGLGMLVGGVASGGVGLLVGGLAGGGAGTAAAAFTGNRDIEIPAESVVRFRLADDLVFQPS